MAISDMTNEVCVKMVTRWINEIASSVQTEDSTTPGIGYQQLLNTTLNTKYGIHPNDAISTMPKLMYFGLGINGFYNVDDGNLSAPYHPYADELDLYEPVPLRCVPADADLDAEERSKYRMRVEWVHPSTNETYICYYLKCLSYPDNFVQLTKTNPVTREEEAYELSAGQLNPTPHIPTTSGEVSGVLTEVNASLNLGLNWNGAEVLEAINIMYNGDMRRAKISEIGIYSGVDMSVGAINSTTGQTITYVESIYTQLAYKICNIGSVVTSASYDGSRILRLTNGSNLLL